MVAKEFWSQEIIGLIKIRSYRQDGVEFEELEYEQEIEHEGQLYNVYFCERTNTFYGSLA